MRKQKINGFGNPIRIDFIIIRFPVSKARLARICGVHRNVIQKWCKWAESDPLMKKTDYNRKSKQLTEEQYFTVMKWARFKYMLMQFQELENGSHLLIYPRDKRLFNNTSLFPKYSSPCGLILDIKKAINDGLLRGSSIEKGKAQPITVYNRKSKSIQTIDHEI